MWHGSADTTVIPSNAREILKQWTDVHGLSGTPTYKEAVAAYPRQAWRNAAGEDVIEAYAIPGMPHGTPLAVGDADDQCGAAGAFLLEVGISSSYHIAKFWGLTDRRIAPAKHRLIDSPGAIVTRSSTCPNKSTMSFWHRWSSNKRLLKNPIRTAFERAFVHRTSSPGEAYMTRGLTW